MLNNGKVEDGKRSPLRNSPLRAPGESSSSALNEMILQKVGFWVLFPLVFVLVALHELMYRYLGTRSSPWFWVVLAVITAAFSFLRIRRLYKTTRPLVLGVEGERAVGQELEGLRADGYQVFHDIVCKKAGRQFNIDHVVIGPGGIFTIETKTISKSGNSKVRYDGQSVTVNGHVPDRDPIEQAQAQRRWLKDMLKESSGKQFPIRPVVVYPGWYVNEGPADCEVWVLNDKRLFSYVHHEPKVLERPDVHLAAYHLAQYVRSPNTPG